MEQKVDWKLNKHDVSHIHTTNGAPQSWNIMYHQSCCLNLYSSFILRSVWVSSGHCIIIFSAVWLSFKSLFYDCVFCHFYILSAAVPPCGGLKYYLMNTCLPKQALILFVWREHDRQVTFSSIFITVKFLCYLLSTLHGFNLLNFYIYICTSFTVGWFYWVIYNWLFFF